MKVAAEIKLEMEPHRLKKLRMLSQTLSVT